MGVTVFPSSLPSRHGGAASSRACASRLRLDPTCIGTAAAAKEPKRPGSCFDAEPPTKRRRAGEYAMSLEEKNGVNRLLLSLLPPGCSPHEVIPLPDSVVRVLQENGTRCCGDGGDDEIEIDVQALGDDALRVIKDRVGAYLEDRTLREEAPLQSKERVIRQSQPRSITSKAASSKSIPSKAAPKSIPPRAAPSLPAPPTPPKSRESVSEPVETAINQSSPRSTRPTASPSLPAPPQPLGSTQSMSELLADAAEVMKKVVRRREIEKLRAAARREVEQMVRTVEFNDPYIDVQDVFK